jgi:hypothetical protein
MSTYPRYAVRDQYGNFATSDSLADALFLRGETGCVYEPLAASAAERIAAETATPDLRKLLQDALERMDRARSILTNDAPAWHCNWGMLDTKDIRAALAAPAWTTAAPTVPGWRDISEAPKDDTLIIGWYESVEEQHLLFLDTDDGQYYRECDRHEAFSMPDLFQLAPLPPGPTEAP